jgi:hypothetical protein
MKGIIFARGNWQPALSNDVGCIQTVIAGIGQTDDLLSAVNAYVCWHSRYTYFFNKG